MWVPTLHFQQDPKYPVQNVHLTITLKSFLLDNIVINIVLVINIELKKYSHLRAEIVSKRLRFWPSEQFWYQRYLPSVQKEDIIAWFITMIWIKKCLKLLSEKIIIPLLRLIFLNYMNQKLEPNVISITHHFLWKKSRHIHHNEILQKQCDVLQPVSLQGLKNFYLIVTFPF